MFLTIRNLLNRLIPSKFKYWLVRNLPSIEIFFAKNLRGVQLIADTDKTFLDLYKNISNRSLLDIKKAYFLYNFAKECSSLNGDIAELGVYRGAGARLIYEGLASKDKRIFLFDTYEGLPKTDAEGDENWQEGDLNDVDLGDVKRHLPEENFSFVKGFFPDSLKLTPINEQSTFSFIHIDFDLYVSTIDALDYFYPKMVSGGIILVDDYGVLACQGVLRAVNEFFQGKDENPIPLFTGQGLIIKK